MSGILGKKIGMTQLFDENGANLPVTAIEAGPCPILMVNSHSVQLGFDEKKEKHTTRPLLGHFKRANSKPMRFVREFEIPGGGEYKLGQAIKVDIFKVGDYVDVTGTSIGKGFQGVVKRHHFKGGPASHGSMQHRAPGSIGSNTFPGRTFKGLRMAGHMGNEKRTVLNLKVVKVDAEANLLVVKGSVPGNEGGYLLIRKAIKKVTRNQ